MRAPMGFRLTLSPALSPALPALLVALAVATVGALGACGKEIGDSCTTSTDCSPNGDRLCDPDPQSPGGYCTIQGCDYSTCPDEAACVRFFTGNFTNKQCTKDTAATDCSLDELCSVSGSCVPRSSEIRYCMKKCDSDGDCRDHYECRDLTKMMQHGGEPVLAPGVPVDAAHAPKFCAAAPSG
jgi:hypothetical protein